MAQKTLADIIEAVKSNEPVTDEELRYSILCLDSLMSFDFHAFMNLYTAEKENKPRRLVNSAVYQFENRFERIKRVMQKIPKEYMGKDNDPANPEYQERRAISNKIVEKVMKDGVKKS